MKPIKLLFSSFNNNLDRGYASYIEDKKQLKVIHNHDYYEIFLVDQGFAKHFVNNNYQSISTGSLCFIRPSDIHCYKEMSNDFRIINIIIPNNIIKSLFDYLGPTFDSNRLLKPVIPPCTIFDYHELKSLKKELEQLILYKKILKEESDVVYRMTIFSIFTKYFPKKPFINKANSIPKWLKLLSLQMLSKENFSKGLPALYQLSGKTPEHVSRCCKKVLNKTPSQLVNDIRIEYAASILISTDTSVIEICQECGFGSLSYFYHRFKEYYGISPVLFRKDKNNTDSNIYLMGSLSVNAEIPPSIPINIKKNL